MTSKKAGGAIFHIRSFCAIPSMRTAGAGFDLREPTRYWKRGPLDEWEPKRLDVQQRSSLLIISREFWRADAEAN